jgi:transposase-like protein
MGRKPKFSKEVKVQACEDYLSGNGSLYSISKSVSCNKESVRQWILRYEKHGDSVFDTSSNNNSYTKEFKTEVFNEYSSGTFSLADLSAKYNIHYSTIRRWIENGYNGIENKEYDPKGEVYTMKSRKTTYEERLEIVNWVIAHDMNYKEAADKYSVKYALVYQWVKKYLKDGDEGLKHKKRGPRAKSKIDESTLSEVERLKLELEREKALREKAEFRLELFKKKEEFAQKRRSRK